MYVLWVYQAKEVIKEAQRCDSDSIFTHFIVYKIAVLENNVEKGIICEMSIKSKLIAANFQHILCVFVAVHLS